MTVAERILETTKYYASLANRNVAAAYLTLPRRRRLKADHLGEAVTWLCAAQDAFGGGGVARSYSIVYSTYFKRRGWIAPYPETTGYIIPTFFDYAHRTGRDDIFHRAVRMTDWECDVQMENGAVQGGTIDAPPTPAIFNTGQVIFGWARAFQETASPRYLEAACRAGDFLLTAQDRDGAWRKHLTDFAAQAPTYTYNTRTAWALLVLADLANRPAYRDASVRNVEFALSQQQPNGWLSNNCLYDPDRPLIHTIAYSLRGILEIGLALRNEKYISAARRAADALLSRQRADGSLAARYDRNWAPTVNYSCLTGNAQMGLIWGRLYDATGEIRYLNALARANRYLESVQWLGTGHPGLDGGISGSFPLHGRYGRFEVLNWATKFFADALMLESALSAAPSRVARDTRLQEKCQ